MKRLGTQEGCQLVRHYYEGCLYTTMLVGMWADIWFADVEEGSESFAVSSNAPFLILKILLKASLLFLLSRVSLNPRELRILVCGELQPVGGQAVQQHVIVDLTFAEDR